MAASFARAVTTAIGKGWVGTPGGTARALVGAASGLCLDVVGQSTAPGGTIDVYGCNRGGNQQWRVNADGTIVGVQSGPCLDVIGGATAPGTGVQVWTCNGQTNQRWNQA